MTEKDTVHRATTEPAEQQDQQRPPFYWELPPDRLRELHRQNLILEDEGYLAHDLNYGRDLLGVADPYEPVPTVDVAWTAPIRSERLSDLIAAVLQVAVDLGYDADTVCSAAITTQRSVRNASAAAAWYRDGRDARVHG